MLILALYVHCKMSAAMHKRQPSGMLSMHGKLARGWSRHFGYLGGGAALAFGFDGIPPISVHATNRPSDGSASRNPI